VSEKAIVDNEIIHNAIKPKIIIFLINPSEEKFVKNKKPRTPYPAEGNKGN